MTGYSAGEWAAYHAGLEAGYALGADEQFAELAELVGGRSAPARPTELEELRWGPGGRAHFADPRPGEYPGRNHLADIELEAS